MGRSPFRTLPSASTFKVVRNDSFLDNVQGTCTPLDYAHAGHTQSYTPDAKQRVFSFRRFCGAGDKSVRQIDILSSEELAKPAKASEFISACVPMCTNGVCTQYRYLKRDKLLKNNKMR